MKKDIRQRVIIGKLQPEIGGVRFPAQRARAEIIRIEPDISADILNKLAVILLYRKKQQPVKQGFLVEIWY